MYIIYIQELYVYYMYTGIDANITKYFARHVTVVL